MNSASISTLLPDDPLTFFLIRDVLAGVLGITPAQPVIEVVRLSSSSAVWRYTERTTGISVVGKHFAQKTLLGGHTLPAERAARLLQREHANLERVRTFGLECGPYQVVRPLAASVELGALLVLAYVQGNDLSSVIEAAARYGEDEALNEHLTLVAGLLAALHQRSRTTEAVDPLGGLVYLAKVIDQVVGQGVIDGEHQERLHLLGAGWQRSGELLGGSYSLIHGDATPANLLFTDTGIVAIDLERLRLDDPAVDLGCVAAELKHGFFHANGNPWAAEQAIGAFYNAYATALDLDDDDFAALTRRGQFYMGAFLLRICRNAWLSWGYRQRLAAEAESCLQTGVAYRVH